MNQSYLNKPITALINTLHQKFTFILFKQEHLKNKKKRSRNWDKLEIKNLIVSFFSLSRTNFVLLALTYNDFFLMKFHTCPPCHHFSFSNSARIHTVFWVYVSAQHRKVIDKEFKKTQSNLFSYFIQFSCRNTLNRGT